MYYSNSEKKHTACCTYSTQISLWKIKKLTWPLDRTGGLPPRPMYSFAHAMAPYTSHHIVPMLLILGFDNSRSGFNTIQ